MFFKKNKNKKQNIDIIKIAALLIHAAKIDENYTNERRRNYQKNYFNSWCK